MALDRDGRLAGYRGVRIKASSANLAPARLNRFSGSEQRGSFNNRGGPPASTPSVPQSPPPETTNREHPDARRTGQPSAEQPAGRADDEKSVTRAPGSDAIK